MTQRSAPFCPQCGQPTTIQNIHGRERPVCTVCGQVVFFDPKVAVAALVTRHTPTGEQILLVQRKYDPGAGKWSVPAGFVDHDEDPAAAAIRETGEETGIAVAAAAIIEILHRPDPDGLADIVITYQMRIIDGDLPIPGDDALDARWFSGESLPEIAFTSTARLLARWLHPTSG